MRRLFLLLSAAVLFGLPALAGQTDRSAVRIDGRAVFEVEALDTLDARTRAERIERRLGLLVGADAAPATAAVDSGPGPTWIVSVSNVAVATVTAADADAAVKPGREVAAGWARAIDQALTDAQSSRQSATGRFSTEVRGPAQAAFARLWDAVTGVVPRALAAVALLLATWLVAASVRKLLGLIFATVIRDRTIENLLRQIIYYAIWVLGFFVAVDALGFRPQTVVTGLGLTGLALGFALKDIISNFVSGLLLLVLRPFEIGDEIVVGETEGRVERIQLRATQIRTYDGRRVLVPNAEIFTSRVANNTAAPLRRSSVEFYLGYGEDLRQTADVARKAAERTPGVTQPPPPEVRVMHLGASDIRIEVRFWADSRRADLLATTHEVRVAVTEALRAAGIALPDPAVRKVEQS